MNQRLRLTFKLSDGQPDIVGWTYDQHFEEMHLTLTKLFPRSLTVYDSAPDVHAKQLRVIPIEPGKFRYIHVKDAPKPEDDG
jgi:hypothetical protein